MVTRYEVETVYTVRDDASRMVTALDMKTKQLDRSVIGVGSSFSKLPLVAKGGLAIVATAVAGAAKSIGHLNVSLNETHRLSGQLGASVPFDSDRVTNFSKAAQAARAVVRGLAQDAARLPGRESDFFATNRELLPSVLAAGGSAAHSRRMVAGISIASSVLGRDGMGETAREAEALLSGRASKGNTLHRLLARDLGTVTAFNAKSATDRITALDRGLERLAGNKALTSTFVNTLETQWGNLIDKTFGSAGLGGIALEGTHATATALLVGTLRDVNGALDEMLPAARNAVTGLGGFLHTIGLRGGAGGSGDDGFLTAFARHHMPNVDFMVTDLQRRAAGFIGGVTNMSLATDPHQRRGRSYTDARSQALTLFDEFVANEKKRRAVDEDLTETRGTPTVPVHQEFHIKVDVQTDASPEAIAVAIQRKQEEQMARAPTRTRRQTYLRINPGGELR